MSNNNVENPLKNYMFERYEVNKIGKVPVVIQEYQLDETTNKISITINIGGAVMDLSYSEFEMLKRAMSMFTRSQGGIG